MAKILFIVHLPLGMINQAISVGILDSEVFDLTSDQKNEDNKRLDLLF